MFNNISSLIMPLLVLVIIIYGIYKKVDVYDVFIEGSKESFDVICSMFPCLLSMILGVNLFIKSGVIDSLLNITKPFFDFLSIPTQIIPLSIMRPISGNASLALLNNIFESFGPDSYIGRLASVIQGSTDTTFYVITLYFGCVGIKKIRYALWAGLASDLIGIIASIIIVKIMFG